MKKRRSKNCRAGVLSIVSGALLLFLSAGMIVASALFRFDKWHALDLELIYGCDKSLRILDINGEELCVIGPEKRLWIPLGSIPDRTVKAFVAAEDNRFYTHSGVDVKRVFGAAWADIKAGGFVQGASTISQQLIKLSHLTSEKTVDRKLEEAVLAMELERNLSKDDIMEAYLNYIYFGGGFYGIEAAARGYFGVSTGELSLAQSAQLAGILKSPSAYSPHIDMEASIRRRDNVLRLMKEQGFISESEYREALKEECVLYCGLDTGRGVFEEHALREAVELTGLSREELLTGGYTIISTAEASLLKAARELVEDDALFPCDDAECAIVLMRKDGGIAAMIGGRGKDEPIGMDRAAEAKRQPGSLIKPILVYAPALEFGLYTAGSVLKDEKTSFGDYSPRNSDDKYYGSVTLREAVARSLNVPAVSILNEIGIEAGVRFAERMGIDFTDENIGLPLALGGFTHGVSPLEMAGAYNAVSAGGVYSDPTAVVKIIGPDGGVIYERKIQGRRVMSEQNAFILTSMLCDAAEYGTAKRLGAAGLKLAAKTGTSVDETGVRDAWCAAFSSEYTAVVWMGTDSAEKGSMPEDAVGGNQPTVMAGKLFSAVYSGRNVPAFEQPEGIISAGIETESIGEGRIYAAEEGSGTSVSEYFTEGTEPNEKDPKLKKPEPPKCFGWSMCEDGCPLISFEAKEGFEYRLIRSHGAAEEVVFECAEKEGYVSFKDEKSVVGARSYRLICKNPLTGSEASTGIITVG